MEEQRISYDTAILASEKGYSPILLGGNFMDTLPTQTIVQKWLREVHNIKLWVEFNYTGEWFCYYINKYDTKIILNKHLREQTFEQALEKGLQETLKLI